MHQNAKELTQTEEELLQNMKSLQKNKKQEMISMDSQKKILEKSQMGCKNMWVNQQDAEIGNSPWTEDQLELLYALYAKYNSRWSNIQKQLPNRTQTKIKNHFYSVLRGITRFVLKYFKQAQRKQTQISNRVTPVSLQIMYKGAGQFQFLGDHLPRIIAEMGFRFNKKKLASLIEKNLPIFQKLNKQILVEEQKNLNVNADVNSQQNRNSANLALDQSNWQARQEQKGIEHQRQSSDLGMGWPHYIVPNWAYHPSYWQNNERQVPAPETISIQFMPELLQRNVHLFKYCFY